MEKSRTMKRAMLVAVFALVGNSMNAMMLRTAANMSGFKPIALTIPALLTKDAVKFATGLGVGCLGGGFLRMDKLQAQAAAKAEAAAEAGAQVAAEVAEVAAEAAAWDAFFADRAAAKAAATPGKWDAFTAALGKACTTAYNYISNNPRAVGAGALAAAAMVGGIYYWNSSKPAVNEAKKM